MNKIGKIILSILAGVEVTFYLVTPILLASLWTAVFGFDSFGSNLIYAMGLGATIFRAIKVGWMK